MELEARLATESHPATRPAWVLTEEARRSLAEQLVGKPVRFNFEGLPVGTVISAECDDEGIRVALEVDRLPNYVRTDLVGPAFTTGLASASETGPVEVRELQAREVALLPKEPGDGDG